MELERDEQDFINSNLETLRKLNFRLNHEDKRRSRNEFKRDYTRVLYSSSFRRLQGKMQLLGVQNDKFYRNRLTHSLEVAQIARAIAENVGYESSELYIVEAGALAHDIGNPAFGHYGEKILNKLCEEIGGFEGNAQTLRVLTRLEKKNPDSQGLNLTLRTLLSVTKYFRRKEEGSKKFIYNKNYDELSSLIEQHGINIRTIDVQIVDLADEIAYAAHDLEDALSLKLFSTDELQYEFALKAREDESFSQSSGYLYEFIEKAKKFAEKSSTYKSSEEYAFILRKELTSILVNELIRDICLKEVDEEIVKKTGTKQPKELGFGRHNLLAEGLKMITFKTINRTDYIQTYEKLGEKVIKGLYEVFSDTNFNRDYLLLPVEYRPLNGQLDSPERLIIDYISGMMDSFAVTTYEKYFGSISSGHLYESKVFSE